MLRAKHNKQGARLPAATRLHCKQRLPGACPQLQLAAVRAFRQPLAGEPSASAAAVPSVQQRLRRHVHPQSRSHRQTSACEPGRVQLVGILALCLPGSLGCTICSAVLEGGPLCVRCTWQAVR